jgi:hypothetical protein
MEFTVVRSEDNNDRFAPWQIWLDNGNGSKLFLDGIEFEEEAKSICACLELAPPRVPFPQNIIILNAPDNRPKFVPKKIEGWKLTETRKLLNEQPKQRR